MAGCVPWTAALGPRHCHEIMRLCLFGAALCSIVHSQETSSPFQCQQEGSIDFADGSSENLEETFEVKLLQVNAELGRTSNEVTGGRLHSSQAPSAPLPLHRQPLSVELLEQAEQYFAPILTSVLLPHAIAFGVAQFLLRRHRGKAAEFVDEATETQENKPRSFSYIIPRVAPMWIIHVLSLFAYGISAPSLDYMYLNSFAQKYSDGLRLDCSSQMQSLPCSRAAVDITQLKVAKGFAHPVIQFATGPALGAVSDAFGRRPAVLFIRVALLLPTMAAAAVAWFDLSIWWEFGVQFLGMIPFEPVPIAWYIDRIDHTPSLVLAASMVESSCILATILGSLLGSSLTLKNAMLAWHVGEARLLADCDLLFARVLDGTTTAARQVCLVQPSANICTADTFSESSGGEDHSTWNLRCLPLQRFLHPVGSVFATAAGLVPSRQLCQWDVGAKFSNAVVDGRG